MKRFEQPGMMPEPTDAEKVKQVRAIMKQATSWTPVVHVAKRLNYPIDTLSPVVK